YQGEQQVVCTLADLRRWLFQHPDPDGTGAKRLGIVAGLLAARDLNRNGMTLSQSTIARSLDPHDFVFKDRDEDERVRDGLEEALALARKNATPDEVNASLCR